MHLQVLDDDKLLLHTAAHPLLLVSAQTLFPQCVHVMDGSSTCKTVATFTYSKHAPYDH